MIFERAKILLPDDSVDMKLWPALACDQFTSQPEYWQEAEDLCKDAKSTLHITLPEIYLESDDVAERIKKINDTMQYYKDNVLTKTVDSLVFKMRYFEGKSEPLCGMVGTIDLEDYSYEQGAKPAIRPSENTVVSRIPPRLEVRKNATLETPHILMLIDDPKKSIIEPYAKRAHELQLMYDTELMLGGGHIKGYALTSQAECATFSALLNDIGQPDVFNRAYPFAQGEPPLTMIVGDGNHSLATAKAHWEQVKKTLTSKEQETHPARFCLVELVNIHSDAIEIEPIHRAVFGADNKHLINSFTEWLAAKGATCAVGANADTDITETDQTIKLITQDGEKVLCIKSAPQPLAVGTVESFLDDYCKENSHASVDYIHDEDAVYSLAKKGAIGILLPQFNKSDLFKGVVMGGVLPRKTFSMGSSREKRYYLECRAIK